MKRNMHWTKAQRQGFMLVGRLSAVKSLLPARDQRSIEAIEEFCRVKHGELPSAVHNRGWRLLQQGKALRQSRQGHMA